MKITMIGTGYVGLVTGTCFAEFGHTVTCVDTNVDKIQKLTQKRELPIYEPGLDTLVWRNVDAGRLKFATRLADAMDGTEAVFICVGTPPREDNGHADLRYVFAAAEDVAKAAKGYVVVVDKSTVPVGTARKVADILKKTNPALPADVVSNPEFLREGAAIADFMNPDRIVIGAESDKARAVMRKLYQPLLDRGLPYVETGLETAELTKYAANAFLATKITFINEIANLCEATGANVDDVAKGIGLDKRIGEAFLRTGPGFGGSCFPKDILAIAKTAQDYQRPLTIVESVLSANTARKTDMARKVVAACGGSVKGKTIAVLGLAFKADTDDMREAPALYILPELAKAGATLKAYDPQAMHEAKKMLPDLTYCATAADALTGADAAVVLTEWKEFRELDLAKAKGLMKGKTFIDLRNLFAPATVAATGLSYTSLGRPTV